MDFLQRIDGYRFLTQETKDTVRAAFQQGTMSTQTQEDVLSLCDATAAQLDESERQLLVLANQEQSRLLQESGSVLVQARAVVETADHSQDDAQADQLLSL